MPDSFAIKPKGPKKHHVAQDGSEAFEHTVSNMTEATLTARIQVVSVNPDSGREWFVLEGEEIRELSPGQETVARVAVRVPPGAEVGSYTFRLLVNAQEDPEKYAAEGPVATVVVGEEKKPFPIWIPIAAGAGVLVIIALVLVIVLSSGGGDVPPRTARLEIDPAEGIAPLTVQFTDLTEGEVTAWAWDFGDGGTSTDPDGQHEFTAAGEYVVKLTVTFDDETTAEASQPIVVGMGGAPADFSANVRFGTVPLTVRFQDLSNSGPTGWTWQFGDEKTDIAQNPTHVYASAGTYDVTLRVDTPGGPHTATKNAFVKAFDPVGIRGLVATPAIGETPLQTKLSLVSATGSIKSVTWTFGDEKPPAGVGLDGARRTHAVDRTHATNVRGANIAGLAGNPTVRTHTYARPGKYTARVVVRGHGGDSKTVTRTVIVAGQVTHGTYLEAKQVFARVGLVIAEVEPKTRPTDLAWIAGCARQEERIIGRGIVTAWFPLPNNKVKIVLRRP